MILSKKVSQLKGSATLALAAKAKELKAQGLDIVSLTVGEPDWPTIDVAKAAGVQAIENNFTTYTPASGILDLKKAVAEMSTAHYGVGFEPDNVTIGSGAKFIIYGACYALCDADSEVIVPAPYWVSYPTMIELAGGIPRIVRCDQNQGFKLTAVQLREALRPKTKMVFLNSPSNPTGAEYSEGELSELAEVLRDFPNVCVLCDDIYNQLTFNGSGLSPHILKVAPDLKDRVVCISGVSKAYSMTGWRIGWAVGSEKIVKAIGRFQSQTTGASSSISQWASVAAVKEGADAVRSSLGALQIRRDFFLNELTGIAGLEPFPPQGAFYLWLNIEDWIGKKYKGTPLKTSANVAEVLLNDYLLALVPGTEFGYDGYLRCSFATTPEDLSKAAKRFRDFSAQLES